MEATNSSHKGVKISCYTMAFKLKVVEYAKSTNNSKAAKLFRVDRKRVIEWKKLEKSFQQMDNKDNRKRKSGGGRKLVYPDIDPELLGFINRRWQAGESLTGKHLKSECLRLHKLNGNQSFKASCGWLRSFMKRHDVSFRTATHMAQKTCPAFLHANSTSHTWCFSAVAELIDNAYDPDVSASKLFIDYTDIDGESCLTFTDNGNGLNAEKLHRMLSFGYCDKVEIHGHRPVGHYGNGFKSGSMRLGKDAIVLTKHNNTRSVGFLSQNFLKKIKAETVLVPILTFEKTSNKIIQRDDTESSFRAITQYSLFKSTDAIFRQFNLIASEKGTRIIIYDLKRGNDGKLELDLESNPQDIINSEHQALDFSTTHRPVREYIPLYRQSLREYCSILYLKPRMQIILRDHKVKTKLVSKSLSRTEKDAYKPVWMDKPIRIIFGFGRSDKDYGMMMYHRNRLIKAYEKVGYQKSGEGKGQGVVGVVSVDFLEPIHNKQDFNKNDRYNACMNSLGSKLNDYWMEKTNKPVTMGDVTIIEPMANGFPDWTWVQCDNCLKWRRLPDGFSDKDLPTKWYCYLNPDPVHSRCDVEEEPEDEDELMVRTTYQKTVRHQQQKEKTQKRVNLEKKEQELQKKQMELQTAAQKLQQQQLQHSISQDGSNKPTGELHKARIALQQARNREIQQQQLILLLKQQAQSLVKSKETQPQKRKSTDGSSDSGSDAKKKKKVPMEFDGFMVTQNDSGSESSDSEEEPKTSAKHTDDDGDDDVILIESDDEVTEWSKKKKGKLPKVALGGKQKKPSGKESEREEKDIKPDVSDLAAAAVQNNNEEKDEKPDIKPEGLNSGLNISDVQSVKDIHNKDSPATSTTAKSKTSPENKTNHQRQPSSSGNSGKDSKESSTASSSVKRKGFVSKGVPTKGEGSSSSSSELVGELKKELEKTKKQLTSLRKNVSDLLKMLVPELKVKELSFVDDIVVEMIKVNNQQNGGSSENGKKPTTVSQGKDNNGATTHHRSDKAGETESNTTELVAEVKDEPMDSQDGENGKKPRDSRGKDKNVATTSHRSDKNGKANKITELVADIKDEPTDSQVTDNNVAATSHGSGKDGKTESTTELVVEVKDEPMDSQGTINNIAAISHSSNKETIELVAKDGKGGHLAS